VTAPILVRGVTGTLGRLVVSRLRGVVTRRGRASGVRLGCRRRPPLIWLLSLQTRRWARRGRLRVAMNDAARHAVLRPARDGRPEAREMASDTRSPGLSGTTDRPRRRCGQTGWARA